MFTGEKYFGVKFLERRNSLFKLGTYNSGREIFTILKLTPKYFSAVNSHIQNFKINPFRSPFSRISEFRNALKNGYGPWTPDTSAKAAMVRRHFSTADNGEDQGAAVYKRNNGIRVNKRTITSDPLTQFANWLVY